MKAEVGESAISIETRKDIDEIALLNLEACTERGGILRHSIREIDKANSLSHEANDKVVIIGENIFKQRSDLRKLNEFTMLLNLILCDVSVCTRININAKIQYEVDYSAKQFIVIINEGFKKVYDFDVNKNGNPAPKNRSLSFWVKDIRSLIGDLLPELVPIYNEITSDLDAFNDLELSEMSEKRHMAVHYDLVPSIVYDMLVNLNIDAIFKKSMQFMRILQKMLILIEKILIKCGDNLIQGTHDLFDAELQRFQDLKVEYADVPQALAKVIKGEQNLLNIKANL